MDRYFVHTGTCMGTYVRASRPGSSRMEYIECAIRHEDLLWPSVVRGYHSNENTKFQHLRY